jgi:ankyrin repeat protein
MIFCLTFLTRVIDYCFSEGTSEVWDWVRKGDLFKLKEVIDKGVNVDAKDEEGRTPLHWAADGYGYEDTIKGKFGQLTS